MARNLNAINLKKTLEPIEPIAETDIDAYLKHEHDLTILTAIEETKKDVSSKCSWNLTLNKCINRFEQQFQTSMEQDWENTKQELLEVDFKSQIRPTTPSAPANANLSFGFAQPAFDQGQQLPFSSPSLGRKRPYQPQVIDNKMAKYLIVINTLIDHKKMSKSFKLLSAFEEVTASSDDRDSVTCFSYLVLTFSEKSRHCWYLGNIKMHASWRWSQGADFFGWIFDELKEIAKTICQRSKVFSGTTVHHFVVRRSHFVSDTLAKFDREWQLIHWRLWWDRYQLLTSLCLDF